MHKFYRTVRTAFRALRRNMMRSGLTTLGIVIGVAAVIAMTEVGQGSSTRVRCRMASRILGQCLTAFGFRFGCSRPLCSESLAAAAEWRRGIPIGTLGSAR